MKKMALFLIHSLTSTADVIKSTQRYSDFVETELKEDKYFKD